MNDTAKEEGASEIFQLDCTIIVRDLSGISGRPVQAKETDCCFTYIQFEKLYPGDLSVRVTLGDGRSLERKFTQNKTVRTALVHPDGTEGEDTQGQVLAGGLGRCIDVDIEFLDTSSNLDTSSKLMKIAHYHFQLCCNNPVVRKGARLTALDQSTPGGQAVKLPLLRIKEMRRDPCP